MGSWLKSNSLKKCFPRITEKLMDQRDWRLPKLAAEFDSSIYVVMVLQYERYTIKGVMDFCTMVAEICLHRSLAMCLRNRVT